MYNTRVDSSRCVLFTKMWKMKVVVLAVLVTSSLLVDAQGNGACSTSDLPAVPGSLDCRFDNQQTSSSQISDGGTCTFLCSGSQSSVSSWRQCHDGEWRGDDRKCEGIGNLAALKNLPRTRRSDQARNLRNKRGWFRDVGCWLFGCSPPRDNRSPTIQGCPSDIHVTADPIQTHTKVSWNEPTAYDDRDGKVRALRHGLAPGRLFSEPMTTMRYTAQDRAGNMDTCSFDIHVHVIRCTPHPPKVDNGYRICHLSTDYRLGSVCWYGCYEGHELTGSSSNTIKCLNSGRWSGSFPRCKKLECPRLRAPPGMSIQCTDGFKFRSICTYSCTGTGYDIPPGRRRAFVCQANQRWSGERDRCKDMQFPKFEPYPRVITAIADRGTDSTRITFIQPDVTDNSPTTIIPVQVKGQQSGSTFSVGVHLIEFHAVDGAGNKAKPLKIKIIVKELVCHTLYRTPYQTVICAEGYRYGSPCYFSCDEDFALMGTANVTCERMGNPPYGAWTFGTRQPTCTVAKQCPVLPAPDNGAMVCDTWFGGQYCQLMCRNGTDIPRSFPNYQLFQCGVSGVWNIKEFDLADKIPNCIKPRPGQTIKQRMRMTYYFNGDCQSNEIQQQIKKSFLKELGERLDCSLYPDCSVENVKVTCGATTRRKRETGDSSELDIEVTFSYDLRNVNDQSEVAKWVSAVTNGVKETAQVGLTTDQGSGLTFVSVDNGQLTVTCPSGHLPNYQTFKCDPCDKGSFHDVTSSTCTLCPKGEYQDTEGLTTCLQCPSGHTTAGKGAADIGSCQASCAAGFVSRTGIAPCSPCELSTYQPQRGQSTCIPCPGCMTTISQAAVIVSECTEFDLDLKPSSTSMSKASLELHDLDLGDVFVITWWMLSNSNEARFLTVLREAHVDWLVVSVKDSSHVTVNSQEYSISVNITDGQWHFFRMDVTSTDCVVSVDGGAGVNRSQTWNSGKTNVSQIILGGDSFIGSVSQFNIWSGGEVLPAQPTCTSKKFGDKLSWSKFVYANLTETAPNLPSECDDFDNCASNPCYHGKCSDGLHSYECECYHGYEGNRCESNVDDCVDNVCENNGTCVDEVGGFSCTCPDLFTGELCEIAVVHGGWADWEDWSTCSVSCGEGVRTRKRSCTDPTPDNGGRECDGLDTQQQICNETVCPVCKELVAPADGSVSCENSTMFINCTVDCDDGFLPDIEPLSSYYCGEQTAYVWNFETEQNPHRRLPFCSKTYTANTLSATYNIKYRDLRCGENEASASIVRDLVTRVLQSDVTCVRDGNCDIDDVSVGCSESAREKRDVSDDNMGFTVTLRNNVVIPETAALLESAMRALQDNAQVGSFTVNISGVVYYVDVNQTDVYGDVTCPQGMASYSYFCVPCGQGSFLSHGSCMLCGNGAYQDKTGQTMCEQCPVGWTTDSLGSRRASDCTVQRLPEPALTTIDALAIAGPVTAVVAVGVIVIFLIVRRFTRRKSVTRPNTPANDLDPLPPTPRVQIPRPQFEVGGLELYQLPSVMDPQIAKPRFEKDGYEPKPIPAWMDTNLNSLQYQQKISMPPLSTALNQ